MNALRVSIDGIGLWSPHLANFEALRALLGGRESALPTARPSAAILPPNERRRAPESVLLAVEVAEQAVATSGRGATELACVFSSSHGDQAITDYMCATLAQAPDELSPTRFHNSVHNAPVGYWTIATSCHATSAAVSAHHESFAAGLLEAAVQVVSEQRPVLLVCSDIAGRGPLGQVTGCSEAFGCALVLSPESGEHTLATMDLQLAPGAAHTPLLPAPLAQWRQTSPSAAALDLFYALAVGRHTRISVSAAPDLQLHTTMEFF